MTDNDRQPLTTTDAATVAAEILFKRVAEIIDGARGRLARAVNSAMVQAYWETGREIVEIEQAGEPRADYGGQVIERLSQRMTDRFGKGFSIRNLERMRQFYLAFSGRFAKPRAPELIVDNGFQEIPPTVWAESPSPNATGSPTCT